MYFDKELVHLSSLFLNENHFDAMKSFCLGYQTKGVRLLQSCFYGKLAFRKGGNLPKRTVNNSGRKPLPSTYINNISQLLEKKMSTTDWLAEITLSLNELSRHLTFESFSPNDYVGNSATWMGFGYACPLCYSPKNDAARYEL